MTWQQATVTKQGLALQAKLIDGKTLHFTKVVSGAGIADAGTLADMTAVTDERQTLTFQPPNVLEGARIRVPVLLTNIGLQTGYQMHQIGFYATDPDAGEILYAIAQDDAGDRIPSESESRGFSADWAYVFEFGNAENVNVQLDPAGLLIIGMLGKPGGVAGLDDGGHVPKEQLPPLDFDPAGAAQAVQQALNAHTGDRNNPHGVTAAQVGADPAGSAQGVRNELNGHAGNRNNPHGVTAAQVGADVAGSAQDVRNALNGHAGNRNNPHGVTKAQVGLDRVDNTSDAEKRVSYADRAGSVNVVPPRVFDFTLGGSWKTSGKATYCKTQEGICIVNLSFKRGSTATTPFDQTIATLPEGFRPTRDIHVLANSEGKILTIKTTGEIWIETPSTVQPFSEMLYLNAAFLAR